MFSMIVALLAVAPFGGAHTSAQRTLIESEPFAVTAQLPEGWTVDEGRVVPPEAIRSVCTVTKSVIQDREWKSVVADALRESPAWRQLKQIGGHEAAEYRTTAGSRLTHTVYINLDSLEPVGVAIWRVETNNTAAGRQCQLDFTVLSSSLRIDPPATP